MTNKVLYFSIRKIKDTDRLLTILVPKKTFKTAVERNRAKRRIKESFIKIKKDNSLRTVLKSLSIKVSATKYVLTEDFDTITTQIKNEINKYV